MLQELSLQQLIEIASENYLENIEYNTHYNTDKQEIVFEEEVEKRVKEQIGKPKVLKRRKYELQNNKK